MKVPDEWNALFTMWFEREVAPIKRALENLDRRILNMEAIIMANEKQAATKAMFKRELPKGTTVLQALEIMRTHGGLD